MSNNAMKRKDLILKYIVEDFIRTAEPVGSQNLIKIHHLDLSSATVRNIMAELEKEGYLEKPHTSAGRVPSTKGYEYYVGHLSNEGFGKSVGEGFIKEFSLVVQERNKSIDSMISEACSVLSDVTKLATVVLGNQANEEKLVSVSLVPINNNAATMVLVTDEGHVEAKTFAMMDCNINAVSFGVQLLNDRLKGTSIADMSKKIPLIKPILKSQVGQDSTLVMNAFMEALVSFTKKRFKAFGTKNLLALPEFSDDDSFREMVTSLNEGIPTPELEEKKFDDNLAISLAKNCDMAMITKRMKVPGLPERRIAVVGPKRMDYKKIISALDSLSEMILGFYESKGSKEKEIEVKAKKGGG